MVFASDIGNVILELAEQRGSGKAFFLAEVAQLIDRGNREAQMEQIQLVAESLIREGQIISAKTELGTETAYAKSLPSIMSNSSYMTTPPSENHF